MRRGRRIAVVAAVAGVAWTAAGPVAGAPPRGNTPEEIQIGRQVVADLDASVKMSADTLMVERLNEMARKLAPRTERPLISYEIRLIEAPVSNAFSIPGGFIYFTDRLVKEARSDDEIAGVMAHEIAHNARQHILVRMDRGATQALRLAELLSLGIFIFSKGGDWGQAAQLGVGALTQSVMSGYSVEDEKDADAQAIKYLVGSEYNPVGFLTFMERQATLQNEMFEESAGFYRTHPFSGDRVLIARRTLEARGIPIRRRAVGAAPVAVLGVSPRSARPASSTATAAWAATVGAPGVGTTARVGATPAVLYDGEVLYYPGAADTTADGSQRNLEALNHLLDLESPADSLWVEDAPDGAARLVAGSWAMELTAADGRANETDARTLARRLRDRLVSISDAERRRVALLYYLIGNERERD